jgi:hypothetical protein
VKNQSHSITADVEIPKSAAAGVILAQGGVHAGRSFYVKDGKPKFAYNYLGAVTTIAADERLPAGRPRRFFQPSRRDARLQRPRRPKSFQNRRNYLFAVSAQEDRASGAAATTPPVNQ